MYGQEFFARLLASVLLSVACSSQATHAQQPSTLSAIQPGNAECAGCHKEISASYQNTVMARASGPAAEGLVTGEFDDQVSGVKYRVFTRDNRVWMSFERQEQDKLRGERELSYFVGSGVKGRSYLFSDEGYLFESPINWYSQEGRWNMAPAYLDAQEIPLTLPSLSSCLNCHTSGLQPRVPGTKNRFTGKPFLHDGITCERCHGEGDGHLTGKGPIVNPAKLPAERRDSICMECHFEGAVSVQQPGKHVYDFRPGDRLSDYIHYFVESDDRVKTAEALSQFEALSLSVCKQKSGERMWCGSCHDPHAEPAAAEKAESADVWSRCARLMAPMPPESFTTLRREFRMSRRRWLRTAGSTSYATMACSAACGRQLASRSGKSVSRHVFTLRLYGRRTGCISRARPVKCLSLVPVTNTNSWLKIRSANPASLRRLSRMGVYSSARSRAF